MKITLTQSLYNLYTKIFKKKVVTEFKNLLKKIRFFLDSTSVFVKYLCLKIIEELNLEYFRNLHEKGYWKMGNTFHLDS